MYSETSILNYPTFRIGWSTRLMLSMRQIFSSSLTNSQGSFKMFFIVWILVTYVFSLQVILNIYLHGCAANPDDFRKTPKKCPNYSHHVGEQFLTQKEFFTQSINLLFYKRFNRVFKYSYKLFLYTKVRLRQ